MATTSCLFLVFVWVVWWLPVMLAWPEEHQGEGCSAKRCGHLNISQPFWLPDMEAGRSCGSLDFEVNCNRTEGTPTPVLRSSGLTGFTILNISYEESSLRVVDLRKEQDLNVSNGCNFPIWNTSGKLAPPFKVSPANLNLVFYNCTKALAHRDTALVDLSCADATNAYARAGVRFDETGKYGGYALEGCNAIVVPVMGSTTTSKVSASHYKQLINGGFLLTWEDHPTPLPEPVPLPAPAPAQTSVVASSGTGALSRHVAMFIITSSLTS
uniref:Putative serine/threonine-protein kinase n=1 Tax=Aegilops tauschii TaxID=37682 RepID=M8BQL4_AEGTA